MCGGRGKQPRPGIEIDHPARRKALQHRFEFGDQHRASRRIHLEEAPARHREFAEGNRFAQPGEVGGRAVAPEAHAVAVGPAEGDVHPLMQGVQKGFVGAEPGQFGVDLRMRQRTALDVGHGRVVRHHIAEFGPAAGFVDVQDDFVAVPLRGKRRGEGGDHAGRRLDPRPGQQVGQLGGLELRLQPVFRVAVTAAGTAPEVGASRFDPPRTGLSEADHRAARIVLLFCRDPADQPLSGQCAGQEHHLPVTAGQAVAPEYGFLNFTLKLGADLHDSGLSFRGCIAG